MFVQQAEFNPQPIIDLLSCYVRANVTDAALQQKYINDIIETAKNPPHKDSSTLISGGVIINDMGYARGDLPPRANVNAQRKTAMPYLHSTVLNVNFVASCLPENLRPIVGYNKKRLTIHLNDDVKGAQYGRIYVVSISIGVF
jgi:hypothetical protein